jgi:hypothetical protein
LSAPTKRHPSVDCHLFERIMNDKPHPEMGYRGCLGIIRLAEKYSAATGGGGRGARVAASPKLDVAI